MAISEDAGQTWRRMNLPAGFYCVGEVDAARAIWLGCTPNSDTAVQTLNLRSVDAGRTWTRLFFADVWVEGSSQDGNELWAIGRHRGQPVSSLWHSRDGGRLMADLKVTQVRSGIGTKPKHRGTLRALGLGRIGKSNVLPDRPEIRGMIARVPHLITVEEVSK